MDEELLLKNGWKQHSRSYLKSWTKQQLFEYIRILEHNWSGEIWKCDLIRKRLENTCEYLKQQGLSLDEINKIISVEGENR